MLPRVMLLMFILLPQKHNCGTSQITQMLQALHAFFDPQSNAIIEIMGQTDGLET